MEQKDLAFVYCPGCREKLMYSRSDVRANRLLKIDCHCGRKETLNIDEIPELLKAILTVQLGQEDWDSRDVKQARANSSSSGLLLVLKNGQSIEIPTPNLQSDLETLKSCGVAIG